jgi:hypothetical protein
MMTLLSLCVLGGCAVAVCSLAGGKLEPIRSVKIGKNREFRVNGRPFFPIMLWAQSEERMEDKAATAVNAFAGRRGGIAAGEYLDRLAANGAYGILHFTPEVADHPYLLGWIQSDEPDLSKGQSEVEIVQTPGADYKALDPLAQLLNGDKLSGPRLDPLQGAAVTFRLKEPSTAASLSIWLTSDPAMATAREVAVEADGKEVERLSLQNKWGEQHFELARPASFSELTLRVLSTYPGRSTMGRINLFSAMDANGKNALVRSPRVVPRMTADEVAAYYRRAKEQEPARPVLMTFTSRFMKGSDRVDDETKQRIYPEYVKHCDVVGFDVYPIFGHNRPDRLTDVADGVSELLAIGGPSRGLYAWIETNAGSRWIDPDRQLPVTPADTRAEVWMAIIRGATAIGYFTHSWWPQYDEFAPAADMRAELARLNAQIAALAPVILAGPARPAVEMSLAGGLQCHFKATERRGSVYVIAQNSDMDRRAGRATVRVEGLARGTAVEVVGEDRTVTAQEGAFSDDFAPLAEHVYRVRTR